jgi:hypothetical protein
MVADGAFNHKIDYWHPNRMTGSKVTAILLNGWILLIGGASSGRVCAQTFFYLSCPLTPLPIFKLKLLF